MPSGRASCLYSGIAYSHPSFRRTNTSYSKWLFFFVRYFAVAMQMYFYPPHLVRYIDRSSYRSSSLLFVGTELSVGFHYTESDCVKWYIFQEVGTQLLVAAVESILIVRGMRSIFLTLTSTDFSPIIHFKNCTRFTIAITTSPYRLSFFSSWRISP